ncbi:MAG: hypothetical protein HFJ27_02420 [Clostridia bacterium]|nr:hypothetical protein [Clostridia bacterium]
MAVLATSVYFLFNEMYFFGQYYLIILAISVIIAMAIIKRKELKESEGFGKNIID